MTGIFLIAVAIAWLCVAVVLACRITRTVKAPGVRLFVGIVTFSLLLAAPLADELIGAFQFDALCRKYAVQVIDEEHAMNQRVSFEPRSGDQFASGTAVRIRIDPYIYRDVETREVLVSFHILDAEGGWLIRKLGISESTSPLLFRSGCAPKDAFGFQKKYNITVIN